MSKRSLISKLFLLLCTLQAAFVSISGIMAITSVDQLVFQILFIPVTLYLTATLLSQILVRAAPRIPRIVTYFNFVITFAMVAVGFFAATTLPETLSAFFFAPLAIYFMLQIRPRWTHAPRPAKKEVLASASPLEAKPIPPGRFDTDRRMFLKLIGSAGVSVFIFTLFTKRAEAAFFGSVPGPGTVALKDSSGNKIDPAEKYPTDGYAITEVDDSSPGYFGYVNKLGQWYITKETSAGAYRYIKGNSDFSTNWTNRAALSYDYFDNVF